MVLVDVHALLPLVLVAVVAIKPTVWQDPAIAKVQALIFAAILVARLPAVVAAVAAADIICKESTVIPVLLLLVVLLPLVREN